MKILKIVFFRDTALDIYDTHVLTKVSLQEFVFSSIQYLNIFVLKMFSVFTIQGGSY